MRNKIFLVLMILWMAVIFAFSSRTGSVSSGDSNRVGMLAGKMIFRDFSKWPDYKQQEFAKKVDHPIRKTAHGLEYAVLGILAFFTIYRQKNISVIVAWALATCYAATDEIHQLFVPGRAGRITDVIIDSTGAIVGIIFVWLCVKVIDTKIKRRD